MRDATWRTLCEWLLDYCLHTSPPARVRGVQIVLAASVTTCSSRWCGFSSPHSGRQPGRQLVMSVAGSMTRQPSAVAGRWCATHVARVPELDTELTGYEDPVDPRLSICARKRPIFLHEKFHRGPMGPMGPTTRVPDCVHHTASRHLPHPHPPPTDTSRVSQHCSRPNIVLRNKSWPPAGAALPRCRQ